MTWPITEPPDDVNAAAFGVCARTQPLTVEFGTWAVAELRKLGEIRTFGIWAVP